MAELSEKIIASALFSFGTGFLAGSAVNGISRAAKSAVGEALSGALSEALEESTAAAERVLCGIAEVAEKNKRAATPVESEYYAKMDLGMFYEEAEKIDSVLTPPEKERWEEAIRSWVQILCEGCDPKESFVLQGFMIEAMRYKLHQAGFSQNIPDEVAKMCSHMEVPQEFFTKALSDKAIQMLSGAIGKNVHAPWRDTAYLAHREFSQLLQEVKIKAG